MCGLAGIFDAAGRHPVDARILARMNDAQLHRGPDGSGQYLGPGIGLAHRRLAIIDVAGGHQPLANEDGSVVVVFNGEIYNFHGLMRELEAAGHVFRTRSDTEVIVHAWEQWGEECLTRFRGMFAFALWDATRQTLLLARDRLGKKPLYYARLPGGTLVFASEIQAVTAHDEVRRDIDPLAVEDYFAYGYVPDPRSIWSAVRKLPPAHRLVWRRGAEPRLERWWRLPLGRPAAVRDIDEAALDLAGHLREATRLRMVADVPLGAFLSGGVDSSAVVAMMARLSSLPVKTFSIAFAEADHDESARACATALRWGTDHTSRKVEPDALGLLDALAAAYGEPFGDSSAVPTWRVCALARQRVTVALSGDGGDEMFGGYRRYALHLAVEGLRRRLPAGLRRGVFAPLGRVWPKMDWAPRRFRAKTTLMELGMDTADGYFAAVSVTDTALRRRLLAPLRRELDGYDAAGAVREAVAAADTNDPLQQIQAADLATWLPGGILVKMDRASMANSLEVRAPLLDHALAEWSTALPLNLRLGKAVLKRAVAPYVDPLVLSAPKQGFSLPLARWFRGPLAGRLAELGEGPVLAGSGMVDMAVVRRLVHRHLAGHGDHAAVLWLLLMFEAFLRRQVSAGPAEAAGAARPYA